MADIIKTIDKQKDITIFKKGGTHANKILLYFSA